MGNSCSSAEVVALRNGSKLTNNTGNIQTSRSADGGLNDVLGHRGSAHISRAAVSLSWLKHFVKTHRLDETRLTTAQVVQQLVKPPTATRQCRFTHLLLENDPSVQKARITTNSTITMLFPRTDRTIRQPCLEQALCRDAGDGGATFKPEQQRFWRRRRQQEGREEGRGEIVLAASMVMQ
ncbi:hypothetical protein VaNZ11_008656, partial [Volvox africanus]